ncbi:F-box only protein 36-like [Oopsacas minuta]|uniref:F-box only protein 36-like n=1 Tax=Oopsacas minuta TaxID=111878 RepID=A0AAV7K4I7_9METZ|nr:F-box only protein 36-like [Oopsacas minuta]
MSSCDSLKLNSCASENAKKRRHIEAGELLLEMSAQERPPLKDFCYLKATTEGVIWRKWAISPRNLTLPQAAAPSETLLFREEYLDNANIQTNVLSVFGSLTARRIACAIGDTWLLKMPTRALISTISCLSLKEVFYLSQVCRALRKLCLCEEMWEQIYLKHLGAASLEVKEFASQPEVGWQKVFFMDRLQLQKELGRRRKGSSRPSSQASCKSSDSFTFLTQATDH